MTATYDVRVCLGRCGFDASYQPPEIHRCPNCGAMLGAVPAHLIEEFRERGPAGDAHVEDVVLGRCPHGVNLDRDFCPEGCRV